METQITSDGALNPEQEFPAVPFAYDFVRPSYEYMARRFEAVEGRTRSLVTLAGSVTFAAIAFVKSIAGEHRIGSPWLLAAALTFVLIIVLAVVATWTARVRAYSPTKVLD